MKDCNGLKKPSKSWYDSKYLSNSIERSLFDESYFNKFDLSTNGCFIVRNYDNLDLKYINFKILIKSGYERAVVHNGKNNLAIIDFIKINVDYQGFFSLKMGPEFAMRKISKVRIGKTTKALYISYETASRPQRDRSKIYNLNKLCNYYQRGTVLGTYSGLIMCLNTTRKIIDQCAKYDHDNPATITTFSNAIELPSPYPLKETNSHL